MRARRRGMIMAVAIGLLFMLGLMVVQMQQSSVQQARLTRTLNTDAEHLYRSEAVLARVINRLKKRPWLVRFYSRGGIKNGPYEYEESGEYREGQYQLWVRDVVVSGRVVPHLVDVFLTMDFNGMDRQFVYRLSVQGATMRRGPLVGVVHFGRTPEDLTSEGGRAAAAAEVTEVLQELEERRPEMRVRMDSLEHVLKPNTMVEVAESEEAPEAGELADRLVSLATADAASLLREDTDTIRTAIHLMGEDGTGFQNMLPPLERGRFTFRRANHPEAQGLLREVFEGSGALSDRLVAAMALGRSLTAEAWAVGPSSGRGRDLIQQTWSVLQQAAGLLNAAGPAELSTVDSSLGAGIYADQMRTAVIAAGAAVPSSGVSWAEQEAVALEGFDRIAAGRTLFGGDAPPSEVLDRSLSPLRTPAAQARMQSDEPMPESGFPRVELGDVEEFQEDPESGWADYPDDSGLPENYWEEAWDESVVREGENGTGDPNPNHDRNGDGVPDASDQPEGADEDADGIDDDHLFDEVIGLCIRGECRGSAELCASSCGSEVTEARDVGDLAFPEARPNPVLDSLREEFAGQVGNADGDGDGDEDEDEDVADDVADEDGPEEADGDTDVASSLASVSDVASSGNASGSGGSSFLDRLRTALGRTKSCLSACRETGGSAVCKAECLRGGDGGGRGGDDDRAQNTVDAPGTDDAPNSGAASLTDAASGSSSSSGGGDHADVLPDEDD